MPRVSLFDRKGDWFPSPVFNIAVGSILMNERVAYVTVSERGHDTLQAVVLRQIFELHSARIEGIAR